MLTYDNITIDMSICKNGMTTTEVYSALRNTRPGIQYCIFYENDYWCVYERFLVDASFMRSYKTCEGDYVNCNAFGYRGEIHHMILIQGYESNVLRFNTGSVIVRNVPCKASVCLIGEDRYNLGISMMLRGSGITEPT